MTKKKKENLDIQDFFEHHDVKAGDLISIKLDTGMPVTEYLGRMHVRWAQPYQVNKLHGTLFLVKSWRLKEHGEDYGVSHLMELHNVKDNQTQLSEVFVESSGWNYPELWVKLIRP